MAGVGVGARIAGRPPSPASPGIKFFHPPNPIVVLSTYPDFLIRFVAVSGKVLRGTYSCFCIRGVITLWSVTPFAIKRHDTLPYIEATLLTDAGPFDLTDATVSLVVRMENAPAVKFKKPAVVVDPVEGKVRYEWEASDTDTEGLFNAEFEVTVGGKVWTFPTPGYIPVLVHPDLG